MRAPLQLSLPLQFSAGEDPVPSAESPSRSPIRLIDHGVRLYACLLQNHDYLWFSGTEFSKRSETLPILHNYALAYSLGDYSYWQGPPEPRYESDLDAIPLYATPAASWQAARTRITYNALDDLTLRTDTGRGGTNTPDLGWRICLEPVYVQKDLIWSARTDTRPGFLSWLFTFDGRPPKGITRLGKKGTAWRVTAQEVPGVQAEWRSEPTEPGHPVNPRDVSGAFIAYEPVAMPPHFLCRRARISGDWFIRAQIGRESHCVHVPRRVLGRLGVSS